MAGTQNGRKWRIGLLVAFIIAVVASSATIVSAAALARAERRMDQLGVMQVQTTDNRMRIVGIERDISYIRARIEDIYEWMKARQQ